MMQYLWGDSVFERDIVERYTRRLLGVVRQRMPDDLRRRLDPEDVVQSVYRSFFLRLRAGEFAFEDSHDLWRLLAVMTFHKTQNAIKYHGRARRDVKREARRSASEANLSDVATERIPGPEDVLVLRECLETLLRGLPDKYQTIIVLRLEGHSIANIAQEVDYSRRTVLRVLAKIQESAAHRLELPE